MKTKVLVAALVLLSLGVGIYFWQKGKDSEPSNVPVESSTSQQQAQEQAIQEAKEYMPTGLCTQALTPAVHTASGAKYTFSSGCIPPGWQAEPPQNSPQ